jgi:enoyl-CoA hydratase/carnithine racemase
VSRVQTERTEDAIVRIVMHGDGTNALDLDLVTELADALVEANADPACRAVVLSSADRHFCAGATAKLGSGSSGWSTADLYAVVPRLIAVDIPVVVALAGAAVGGGAGLALIGDWRQMDRGARIQINFSRLGYTPGFGIGRMLPDLVGVHRADELMMSGRSVGAEESLAIGLCDAVSDEGALLDDAVHRAVEYARAAPLAVRAIKARSRRALRADLPLVLREELALQDRLRATDDYREGMAAARERRPPEFRGR